MKQVVFLLGLILILFVQDLKSCDLDVDSLFNEKISFLERKIKEENGTYFILREDDISFLVVFGLLANKNFMDWYEYKYNPRVSLKEINLLKDWYYKKKGLITCEKVEKAYLLLSSDYVITSFEDYEIYEAQLDSLSIQGVS